MTIEMPPGGRRGSYEVVYVVALVLPEFLPLPLPDAEPDGGAVIVPEAELPVGLEEAESVFAPGAELARVPWPDPTRKEILESSKVDSRGCFAYNWEYLKRLLVAQSTSLCQVGIEAMAMPT